MSQSLTPGSFRNYAITSDLLAEGALKFQAGLRLFKRPDFQGTGLVPTVTLGAIEKILRRKLSPSTKALLPSAESDALLCNELEVVFLESYCAKRSMRNSSVASDIIDKLLADRLALCSPNSRDLSPEGQRVVDCWPRLSEGYRKNPTVDFLLYNILLIELKTLDCR